MDRLKPQEIDTEAKNRAVAASKQGLSYPLEGDGEKSLKAPQIKSANENLEERDAIYEQIAGIDRKKSESMAIRDVSVKYEQQVAKKVKETGDE